MPYLIDISCNIVFSIQHQINPQKGTGFSSSDSNLCFGKELFLFEICRGLNLILKFIFRTLGGGNCHILQSAFSLTVEIASQNRKPWHISFQLLKKYLLRRWHPAVGQCVCPAAVLPEKTRFFARFGDTLPCRLRGTEGD